MNTASYRRLVSLPVLLLLAQPGFAQQPTASASGNGSSGSLDQLQEVVVTAERRKENVLTVPMALQAMTATQLKAAQIHTLTDLQFTTPGFLPTSGEGYTQLYIRGIGNDIFVGADPSVATFVDGVPYIWGSMDQQLVDVERVEILKGAQGGLYGRNATGGVVNVITRQPSTTQPFNGDALVDYGTMGTVRVAAWANVPVNDKVAFLFSGERDSHGPYVTNLATSTPYTAAMFPNGSFFGTPQQTAALLNSHTHPDPGLNNGNYWATDDKMLLRPTDNLKVTIAGDYSAKVDSNGAANLDTTPTLVQGFFAGLLGETIASPVIPGTTTPTGFTVNLPAGFEKGPSGKYKVAMGDPGYVDAWDYGTSATVVWDVPDVELTSISAYRGNTTNFAADGIGGSSPGIDEEVDIHRDMAYQELRAQSTYHSRFSWITGATYLADNVNAHTGVSLFGGIIPTLDLRNVDRVHNWSIYGQGTYDILPRLSLTVSYRYEHETNVTKYSLPVVATARTGLSKSIPSATLSYRLGNDGNVYARWARGVKAGGVNPTSAPASFPPGDTRGLIFAPEQVDTYEVGYRKALLNGTAQLTTDIFYNNYTNIQFSAHANAANAAKIILAIVNAQKARTYGAEESFDWRVFSPITIGVNLGYLDAKYQQASLANSTVLSPFNFDGKTMLNAPRWQGSFTGNLDLPLNDRLNLIGNVMVSYISNVVFDYSAVPGVVPDAGNPAYWLTNARLGVQTSDGKYSFTLWAKNLFNRAYFTYGNSAFPYGNQLAWGDPRVVGGEISARF